MPDANPHAVVQRLVDELAIRRTIDRYADAITSQNVDAFAALFTENAVWDVPPPFKLSSRGRAAIRQALLQTWQQISPEVVFFLNGAVIIESITGNHARARSQFQEITRRPDREYGFVQFATYIDDLVKIDDDWYFQQRSLHPSYIDFRAPMAGQAFEVDRGRGGSTDR